MNKKYLLIGIVALILVIGLTWAYIESTKPLPGQEALQDSRTHIPEGSPTNYKFNPPTSGDHYPSWITKGVYDTPRPDGNLVHSLEHGYIIFWYDCEKKLAFSLQPSALSNLIPAAFAQVLPMTQSGEGSPSAKLEDMPKAFSDGSCNNLESQLKDIYNQFGQHKLIVVPRVGIDHPLVVTSWGRMLKLERIDKDQIKRFINFFRDHGPEQTNEP